MGELIKLNACVSCSNYFKPTLIMMNNEMYYHDQCSFCRRRDARIKKIKSMMLELKWELYLIKDGFQDYNI